MKIVFFNRFFFPDASATSQILSDLAFHLATSGKNVHVVTTRTAGDSTDAGLPPNMTVHRVAGTTLGPHGLFRRGLDYAKYFLAARRTASQVILPGDTVVLMTDPPMLSAAVTHLARSRGARVIHWLQDLFPEVAREHGVPGMHGPAEAFLRRVRDKSLATADAVVTIGDEMAARVRLLGCVDPERLHVIHNWADARAITPIDRGTNPLRHAWNLNGKFVVAYSGNLGRVHEFDTLLKAAARLADRPEIQFLIIGRGPRLAELQAAVATDALSNIRFEPHQEREQLSQSLSVGDVHLSILRPEFEGLVHPSKLYGIMAAGRPTIFIGRVASETSRILSDARCGITVETGDSAALAAAIVRLLEDAAERDAMGHRAREALIARYEVRIGLARWESVLDPSAEKLLPAEVGFAG